MYKAVDLFAGCGGMSLGFQQAGFKISDAVEFDGTIAGTYRKNFPDTNLVNDSIEHVDDMNFFKGNSVDVVIGGPPCQGFSMAGSRNRVGFTDDPRNYLFKHYFNIVKSLSPKVFIMENVKGMLSMQGGNVFRAIINAFEDKEDTVGPSYSTAWKIVQASDLGIPQKRERLMIVGLRDETIDLDSAWSRAKENLIQQEPTFFDPVTVESAIGNLPIPTDSGHVCTRSVRGDYEEYLAVAGAPVQNHKATKHSQVAVSRMSKIAPGENYSVLDEKISSVHSGSYGRLRWSDLASTITTRFDTPAGGRFTHPELDRTLTPREAARIQSFPDSFEFEGDNRSISRQIGNAVPPKLARFMGEVAKELL